MRRRRVLQHRKPDVAAGSELQGLPSALGHSPAGLSKVQLEPKLLDRPWGSRPGRLPRPPPTSTAARHPPTSPPPPPPPPPPTLPPPPTPPPTPPTHHPTPPPPPHTPPPSAQTPHPIPSIRHTHTHRLAFSYSAYRLAVLGVCVVVAALMFLGIERTRVGSAIRAAAEKPEMVDLLGLDARRIHMLVFAAGTALAMLAGALAAPLYSVYPHMGDGFLIICFVVVVVGGIGSVAGAFWGALLIGLVDTMAKAYLPAASGLMVYVLMAVVLLWRPAGLFAKRA